MKQLLFLLIGLILLLPAAVTDAQVNVWQVALYNETVASTPTTPASGEIVLIDATGVRERRPIPQGFFAPYTGATGTEIRLGPNFSTGIGYHFVASGGASPLALFDLQSGFCCTQVSLPVPTAEAYQIGGFSPDGSQVAVAYLGGDFYTNPGAPTGGLAIIDVATGQTVQAVDWTTIASISGDAFTAFAFMGDWKPDGIRFVPTCYACEGTFDDSWYVWNPATNQISALIGEYFSVFGSQLAVTGEFLYTVENANYPLGSAVGMFPPANVVEYYANGRPFVTLGDRFNAPALAVDAPIVYFNPTNLDLRVAEWVADGRAFVIPPRETYPQSIVVFRDASQVMVASDGTERFVAGTPDGWLTQDSAQMIYQYRVNGQTISRTPLLQLNTFARVVQQPDLGALTLPPFTTINPTVQVAPATPTPALLTQCPGFLPSRLVVNQAARVTPGDANRLRAQPNLSAAQVGSIPGGAPFLVLAGPVCDAPNGIAWWQVDYGGVVGWTAEGQGSTYWTEPLN